MQPIPGDDAFARSRPADGEASSAFPPPPPAPQMTYVLADESTVDVSLQQASLALQRQREARKSSGQESVTTMTTSQAGSFCPISPEAKDGNKLPPPASHMSAGALEQHDDEFVSEPTSLTANPSPLAVADSSPQPTTPSLLETSRPASALSSVSSRRNSFTGSLDLESHAPESHAPSADEEAADRDPTFSNMMDSGSAPQLVMPSIKMPSRRPFTDAGKSMGRLKVLIAGNSGVGKTSLVKAIVQSCQHIVHVDPIVPPPTTSSIMRSHRRQTSRTALGTTQITEIFASTKPYPEWWSDLDDLRILKRRKSLGDTVLDRNLCFVDTPGYGNGSSAMDVITPVVQYVESHLQRMSSNSLPDGDVLNMLGGDGGVQVDAVLYMISNRLKPTDIQYLRQLIPLTNVIPLLAQADLMSPEQVAASKEQIECQLKEADLRPFTFTMDPHDTTYPNSRPECPYAISSAIGSDHDTMDASLLMSPDYVQPLIPTDLATLVERLFSQDGASRLRHLAARKYIQWRRAEEGGAGASGPRPTMDLYRPLSLDDNTPYAHSHSQVLAPPIGPTSSFAIARIADHTQREERLAQIRLASWAADLQKSLENERAHYERLARGDRATWLTERLGECVQDGTLVPVRGSSPSPSSSSSDGKTRRKKKKQPGRAGTVAHQDPLGLLGVAADLRQRSLVVLEVVGGLGVLGGIAVWLSKHCGPSQPYSWVVSEWDKFWYGGR